MANDRAVGPPLRTEPRRGTPSFRAFCERVDGGLEFDGQVFPQPELDFV